MEKKTKNERKSDSVYIIINTRNCSILSDLFDEEAVQCSHTANTLSLIPREKRW